MLVNQVGKFQDQFREELSQSIKCLSQSSFSYLEAPK